MVRCGFGFAVDVGEDVGEEVEVAVVGWEGESSSCCPLELHT